jgi:branched-chain amino acid transport system ATP-binding protein
MSPHAIAGMGMSRTFQNIELFENLTVIDNLMLGRHQHVRYGLFSALLFAGRAKREEIAHRAVVEDIIDFLEIEQYRKFPVGLLPYGIQKRVELGRALALEPKLLLLDEPVAGMNLEETEDMARFILDIRDELSIPMILVEHDMGLVMDIADRVLALDFGKPIAIGPPGEVQRDPNVVHAYLGQEHDVADTPVLEAELPTAPGGDG